VRSALQRLKGSSFVEVNDSIKLLGQARLEVMPPALGLRPVDHPDRSLQPSFGEQRVGFRLFLQIEPEAGNARCMEEPFIAVAESGSNVPPFGTARNPCSSMSR
jgi:hypothetical protein